MNSAKKLFLLATFFTLFAVSLFGIGHGKASLSKEQQKWKGASGSAEQGTKNGGGGIDLDDGRQAKLHSGDDDAQARSALLLPPSGPLPHGLPPNFDGVPPGFEKVLPIQTLQQLRDLHRNQQIPLTQKQAEFDRIMSAVPAQILAKLPLPPGFEALPDTVQQQIRTIHGDGTLNWAQKHQKVAALIESLPADQRPRPPPGFQPSPQQSLAGPNAGSGDDFFPPNPPPGFEKVLPTDVYQRLVQIHRNPDLNWRAKSDQIDQIMRALPQNIIDRLPLPPGFDQLPPKYIAQARAIFGDKTLNFHEKDQKVFQFVHSLPPALRKKVRPPLPPAFERLNSETKDKIAALFDDTTLEDAQRQKRFWQLVEALPSAERAQVEAAFKFPA